MKLTKKAKDIFKRVNVDLSTYKVNPNKKFNPKTAPGLKKGSGGVDNAALAAGVAEGSVMFIRGLMLEAIEDITDTTNAQALNSTAGEPADNELGNDLGNLGTGEDQVAVNRSVKGAHLVFKRQADVDSYEELWIYEINPKDPTAHSKVEELILAGTDISPTTMSSEDGGQRAVSWVAGNAKMLHITGLMN